MRKWIVTARIMVCSVAAVVFGSAHAAAGQDTPALRVETQLVVVDVVATGTDGPAADLDVEDFSVLDTGVEQQIAFFERYTEADRFDEEAVRLSGEKTYSATVMRALEDFVRRAKARRILELRGSGTWEGDLGAMRRDRSRKKRAS